MSGLRSAVRNRNLQLWKESQWTTTARARTDKTKYVAAERADDNLSDFAKKCISSISSSRGQRYSVERVVFFIAKRQFAMVISQLHLI